MGNDILQNEVHLENIKKAKKAMPSAERMGDAAFIFKMLGDNTRLRIIMALMENEMCVCDLAELLQMTKSAVSHQLAPLRNAKLIKYRKSGKNVFYSLDDAHVTGMVQMVFDHIAHQK